MTLPVFRSPAEFHRHLAASRRAGQSIGLVPTMGALHAGHAVLIETARAACDLVAVTIFVNPLQFGPKEDLARYPRAFENDLKISQEKGASVIFAPEVADMYPTPQLASVDMGRLTEHLCGAFRPGHFRGVATVVLKLLNIAQPDRAYFGEKDFQQLMVIRKMVQDLNVPVTIVGVPTVREADGLALSSRNVRLSPEDRRVAPALYRSLEAARDAVGRGETDAAKVKTRASEILAQAAGLRLEYFEIVELDELQPVARIDRPVRIAAAVWLGTTRLIDNIAAQP